VSNKCKLTECQHLGVIAEQMMVANRQRAHWNDPPIRGAVDMSVRPMYVLKLTPEGFIVHRGSGLRETLVDWRERAPC
jgi:hypothetical protein